MLRTTTLSAAALLGLSLLVAPGASAAAPTCRGEAATVVGTRMGSVTGTEGRDVIVTNGATSVTALGGDDLICVTGERPGLSPGGYTQVELDAGAGDDVVEVTVEGWGVRGELGSGADELVSTTTAAQMVDTGTFVDGEMVDTERDVVRTGAGPDMVRSGQDRTANPDVVTTGDGGDVVWWAGTAGSGVTDGGPGGDHVYLAVFGTAVVDNLHDLVTIDGTVTVAPAGFEAFWISSYDEDLSLTYLGSDEDETVRVAAPAGATLHVRLRRGDDRYVTSSLSGATRMNGGGGRDRIELGFDRARVDLDLRSGRLTRERQGTRVTARARGFEDAGVVARRAVVAGTLGTNGIALHACISVVRARAGRDTVDAEDYLINEDWHPRCGKRKRGAVVHGGAGPDRIAGTRANDRLVGDRGRDVVDGDGGRDVCRAERTKECEVRSRR